MVRWVTLGCVLVFLMAILPADLFGQFNPNGSRFNPFGGGVDPRLRRAYREQAVAMVGFHGRDFVETQGDEAVAAIFACSRPVAMKLAKFHASGEMAKLLRPRDLLRVIAQPGYSDDVALWAMNHAGELADRDSLDAFLINPLDYAMGFKAIAAGAAEARARRLNQDALMVPLPDVRTLKMVGGISVILIVGYLIKRRKQPYFPF